MYFRPNLKKSAWLLRLETVTKDIETIFSTITGVQISKKYILTCAHYGGLFQGTKIDKIMGRKFNESSFSYYFKTVHVRPEWDLRLLKCVNKSLKNLEYSRISKNGNLSVGELLYSFGNPKRGLGSFYKHLVAFPCRKTSYSTFSEDLTCGNHWLNPDREISRYRTLGDFYHKKVDAPSMSYLNPNVPIIYLYGLCTAHGCSGGPMYTQKGNVIGILITGGSGSIAIHASAIRVFLDEAKGKKSRGGEKRAKLGKKRSGEEDDSRGGEKRAKLGSSN